jgi:TolB protein
VYSSNLGRLRRANLFVVSADGGEPKRLTTDQRYAGAPSWSPDGAFIYYEGARTKKDESTTDIWRIRAP